MLYFSRWSTVSILLVVLAGIIFAAPNLISKSVLDGLRGRRRWRHRRGRGGGCLRLDVGRMLGALDIDHGGRQRDRDRQRQHAALTAG